MFGNNFNNNGNKKFGTGYNIQLPSFIDGIGSSVNICGNYYKTNFHSDLMSLRNDWETIGNDFKNTMNSRPSSPSNSFRNNSF